MNQKLEKIVAWAWSTNIAQDALKHVVRITRMAVNAAAFIATVYVAVEAHHYLDAVFATGASTFLKALAYSADYAIVMAELWVFTKNILKELKNH